MNVLIIEDEPNAANDLLQMIAAINPGYKISAITDSVESTLKWLQNNRQPDLVFSDIQLGDGICFEIFEAFPLSCPIIFTTAYNEFMLQAFENNGVSFLLKPIEQSKLEAALNKLENLKGHFLEKSISIQDLATLLGKNSGVYRSSFLVSYKEKRFPIAVEEIACFVFKNTLTYLYTTDGKSYIIAQRLEELESLLDPHRFFRANRQYLVSFKAIVAVEEYFARKTMITLSVKMEESVIVSKPRSAAFLHWLENR